MPDIPFMRAEGHVPGPTQRPVLAGAIGGALASGGATALMWSSDALHAIEMRLGAPAWAVFVIEVVVFALAGGGYGRIFGRAANDREGGWLFGLSYGFLVWMLIPATILQLGLQEPLATGQPAVMLFLAHMVYGVVLGLLFPHVHRLIQRELSDLDL